MSARNTVTKLGGVQMFLWTNYQGPWLPTVAELQGLELKGPFSPENPRIVDWNSLSQANPRKGQSGYSVQHFHI